MAKGARNQTNIVRQTDREAGPKSRAGKYEEDMPDRVLAMALEGKFVIQWAAEFNVTMQTMYRWANQHPEFEEALTLAYTKAAGRHLDLAISNMRNPDFRVTMWAHITKSFYPSVFGPNPKATPEHFEARNLPADQQPGQVPTDGTPGTQIPMTDEQLKEAIAVLEKRRKMEGGA